MDPSLHAAAFFDGFAEAFDSLYDNKRSRIMRWVDRRFRSDMFIRFALTFEAFGDLNNKTVLDIGCGSGPYVVEAFRRGASRVIAVDPAPNMLALAERRLAGTPYADRCTLVQGLFPNVDVERCDHVIVMGVMDYVADAGTFLKALRSLVKTSAAVSFPSRHWFRTPLRKFRYKLRRCPVYFYPETLIREMCSATGFGEVRLHKIPGAGMDHHVCLRP